MKIIMEFDIHQFQWQFINSPSEDDFCSLCRKILSEPMLTECCGTHICKSCAEPTMRSGKLLQCYTCNETSATCMVDKSKWRNILELKVYCPYQAMGCKWTGCIKKYHIHLSVNCVGTHSRQAKKDELFATTDDGSSPVVRAKYDIFTKEDLFERRSDHTKPIRCHNRCGKRIMPHEQSAHNKVCLELIIPCEYEYAGCSSYSERKHLAKHMKNNLLEHSHLQSSLVRCKLEESCRKWQESIDESKSMLQKYLLPVLKLGDLIEQSLMSTGIQSIPQVVEMHNDQEQIVREAAAKQQPSMLWELKRQNLTLESKLHAAQFSEVWKGMQFDEYEVVIKKHKLGTTTASNFLQEAHILAKLEHENIVCFVGVCTEEEPTLVITEYMCHGNLLNFLKHEGKLLTLADKLTIIQHIVSGMAYLESMNCIHRAVSSRSILIGDYLKCKIGSFSLAHILDGNELEYKIPQGERVPIRWSAPEVLNENKCSTKSDVWSFGILQYEIITSEGLKMTNTKAESFITSGIVLDSPPNCPKDLYEIMILCWKMEADSRPSFSVVEELLEDVKSTDN